MSCEEGLVNVRPLNEAQSKYRLCTAWRLGAIAAFGSLLFVTQGTNYTHHLHAHIAKHQILRNLQEQPALRLTFELKRKAMYVHGASTFDVIATPAPKRSINDKRMAYNGIASFVKEGNVHEYSLVDGMSYYTHRPSGLAASVAQSTCLPAGTIPPIGSALDAIKNARTFVQTSADNRKCPDSSVMLFEFAGEDFFLCADHFWAPNVGFQIFGKHVDIHVKYEQTVPEIVAPRVPIASINACKQVSFGDRITPSLPSMLTRSLSEWSHRALRAEFNLFKDMWDLVTDESSCSCKGVKRACVFVAGLSSYVDHGLTDQDITKYFGNELNDHSPCCLSRQYITLATKKNFWDDPVLQQRLVDLTVQVSGSSDPTSGLIKDTIFVGHSMANLILAGAIANGKATIDPSTAWVATSAPMEGSMGSNYIQSWCDDDISMAEAKVIDLLGNCPTNAGEMSLAYQNSSLASHLLNDAYVAAQQAYASNVTAVMCSNNYMGLATVKAAIYALAGELVPHHSSENDGIVEYSSCAMGFPLESFGTSYKSERYVTELNHVDTSFRNGDGVFGDSRKPLKWFECLL